MLNFVIICHKGELEYQAMFLVWSLKKHLQGEYMIHIAIPNDILLSPSEQTSSTSSKMGCRIYHFENPYLNNNQNELTGDKCSNKIYALKALNTKETVILLDSDIIAIQDLKLNALSCFENIGIKPVNRIHNIHWRKLYQKFSVQHPKSTVKTSIDKKTIPPYFNSGVVVIPPRYYSSLINTWENFYLQLSQKDLLKQNYYPVFFRDQIALALAIQQLGLKYELLDEKYNFPIRGKKIPHKNKPFLVHYHRAVSIASYKILRNMQGEFIQTNSWAENIMPESWKFFFKTTYINRIYRVALEKLKYKKYLFKQKIKNPSYSLLKNPPRE